MAPPQMTPPSSMLDADLIPSFEKTETQLKAIAALMEEQVSCVSVPLGPKQSVDGQEQVKKALEALQSIKMNFNSTLDTRIAHLWRYSNEGCPIYRIPNELLVEIFKLAAPTSLSMLSGKAEGRTTEPDEDEAFDIPIYPFKRLLDLTHVCFHWRQTALTTPGLWQVINMDWPLAVLEIFIYRSSGAPLSVTWGDAIPEPSLQKTRLLFPTIRNMSSLKADFSTFGGRSFGAQQLLSQALPKMQTLSMAFAEQDQIVLDADLFQRHAPHLRSLSLFNVAGVLSHGIFSRLTALRIHYTGTEPTTDEGRIPISVIFLILEEALELEILQFTRKVEDPSMELRHSHSSFEAKKLRSLILEGWEINALDLFFSIIVSPSLKELKVAVAPRTAGSAYKDLDMLFYLHNISHKAPAVSTSYRHLAMSVDGMDNVVISLSSGDTCKSPSPRGIFIGLSPPEDDGEMLADEYLSWATGFGATIRALSQYFILPQLVSFVFRDATEDEEDSRDQECWREFFRHCTALEELEIAGLGSSTPILAALTPSLEIKVETNEASVLCPSLHTLRIPQPMPLEEGVIHAMVHRRRLRGCMVRRLTFVVSERIVRDVPMSFTMQEIGLWISRQTTAFEERQIYLKKEVGSLAIISRDDPGYPADHWLTGHQQLTLADEQPIY
ncbi:hypothetical protein SISSUDRAFT_1044349 [Sistotremastrum suecicum HHB10207 ss-3]|uniref:Uncharacterized protein n=1 Tax=Sistotremastrum suecicum HHB10207 ss-3 TaxID=1314776 RepID=A0A166F9N8_9AGAM|nr:hypothetical protein SISSUDRAFT_1044349 [Sistotremastrum suecicum HHB10207 ss-3]